MKDTLIYIVKSIVDNPDKVVVDEVEGEEGINFIITVDPADMGKIIGKSGKVIRSIRNIMKIPAIKQNKRVSVSLAEIKETK